MRKIISVLLCVSLCFLLCVPAFAEKKIDYKISNPYESVSALLADPDNHYKTSLHSHSTVSDADEDFATMIKGFYNEDFDIVGFAEHGVIGKYWNEKPTQVPLYLYQYIIGNKKTYLTDEEYNAITNGTYPVAEGYSRTEGKGMHCVPTGIELNMLTISKSHVCGYFSDFGLNDVGFENGYEYAVKNVEKAGGISFINHPGDWSGATSDYDSKQGLDNIRRFSNIFMNYETCCGMEVFNDRDIAPYDRMLWDRILQYVIPHGERNVWGFANNDAHNVGRIDTSFMDFILPEYSLDNVKNTMINGNFFAIGRYAKAEMGNEFRGTGAYPTVTSITVDEENDTITVTGKDTDKIQWIANGDIIEESSEKNGKGETVSTIKLREHSDKITCYVRFQLLGQGGVCIAQPFICDDGNMSRFIIPDNRTDFQKFADSFVYNICSLRISIIIKLIINAITK